MIHCSSSPLTSSLAKVPLELTGITTTSHKPVFLPATMGGTFPLTAAQLLGALPCLMSAYRHYNTNQFQSRKGSQRNKFLNFTTRMAAAAPWRHEKRGRILTAQLDPRNTYKGMREMEETQKLKHWGRRPPPPRIIHFQKQRSPPRPQRYLPLCNSTCSRWKRTLVWCRCQYFETRALN